MSAPLTILTQLPCFGGINSGSRSKGGNSQKAKEGLNTEGNHFVLGRQAWACWLYCRGVSMNLAILLIEREIAVREFCVLYILQVC